MLSNSVTSNKPPLGGHCSLPSSLYTCSVQDPSLSLFPKVAQNEADTIKKCHIEWAPSSIEKQKRYWICFANPGLSWPSPKGWSNKGTLNFQNDLVFSGIPWIPMINLHTHCLSLAPLDPEVGYIVVLKYVWPCLDSPGPQCPRCLALSPVLCSQGDDTYSAPYHAICGGSNAPFLLHCNIF